MSEDQKLDMAATALTPGERSALHVNHATARKHSPELAQSYDEATSRKEKGRQLLAWSLAGGDVKSVTFQSLTARVTGVKQMEKLESWNSWTQIVAKFGEEEAELHLQSGRLISRQDPLTIGVWQYQDTNDTSKRTVVGRSKELERNETQTSEDDSTSFDALFDAILSPNALNNMDLLGDVKGQQGCKGLSVKGGQQAGKGKANQGQQGGKGKANQGLAGKNLLALEDMEPEQQIEKCLDNSRKMLQALSKMLTLLEETITIVKQSKMAAQRTNLAELNEMIEALEEQKGIQKNHLMARKTVILEIRT